MAGRRRGGTIFVKTGGIQRQAKGAFSYNLGRAKRTMIVGSDEVHGHSEKPQPSKLEGLITDSDELNVDDILLLEDVEVTLELANGKVIVFPRSTYTGDGDIETENGEIQFMVEGDPAQEIR